MYGYFVLLIFLSTTHGYMTPCQIGHLNISSSKGTNLLNQSNCGSFINASEFKEPPQVSYESASIIKNYTLMLLSKNQSSTTEGYFLNWLISNVMANDSKLTGGRSYKTVLADYIAPYTNLTKGIYKYMFLVYSQMNAQPIVRLVPFQERKNFSIDEWNKTQAFGNLVGPIGGSEFLIKANIVPNTTIITTTSKPNKKNLGIAECASVPLMLFSLVLLLI